VAAGGLTTFFSPCRLDTRRRSRLVSCSRRIATKSLRRAARSIVVMIGAVFALLIVGNLAVDVLYGYLDPRIRYSA